MATNRSLAGSKTRANHVPLRLGTRSFVVTSGLFLKLGLVTALLPAAVAVALSGGVAEWYTKLIQPGLLLVCCLLSLWTAMMYRSHLRQAFLFLSAFLFSYGLVNITPLVDKLRDASGDSFLTVTPAAQKGGEFRVRE